MKHALYKKMSKKGLPSDLPYFLLGLTRNKHFQGLVLTGALFVGHTCDWLHIVVSCNAGGGGRPNKFLLIRIETLKFYCITTAAAIEHA